MSTKIQIPYWQALEVADELVDRLSPDCERIEIAGSIRRRKPHVSDIEIVAIPKMEQLQPSMFGDASGGPLRDALDERLSEMRLNGDILLRRSDSGASAWGRRLKRAIYRDVPVDLFSVLPPAQWGVIMAIRTGPADFSRRFVTARWDGGLMPAGYRVRDGHIENGRGQVVETPEERDVFEFLGIDWIEPEERT